MESQSVERTNVDYIQFTMIRNEPDTISIPGGSWWEIRHWYSNKAVNNFVHEY